MIDELKGAIDSLLKEPKGFLLVPVEGEETRGISNLSLLNFQSDCVCFNSDYHYHHHFQLYSSKKVQMQFLCGINIMFKFEHPTCESLV
ncbi:hypothetical protein NC651_034513 [Populus alba x Populus x berolinensis]|nr:hypothetical protein NC651_034513 [Populus alba x Populus x berolinensis]